VRPGSGVLVVDKPAGPTSFEVVERIRRAAGAGKAGHAGTLDPAATGVLAVCLDDAVKLQHFLTDGDKAYLATIAFGRATTTEDGEGEVVETGDPSGLDAAAIRAALPRFVGEIDQVPPMFSAVRVGGRRLHEAARAGEAVDRAARRVHVHALELVEVAPLAPGGSEGEHGVLHARVAVSCGKGTYVRTLAADLGRALGVPAHLAALRRTSASGFTLADALPLEAAEALAREGGPGALRARAVPPHDALRGLPVLRLSDGAAWDLVHGRAVARPDEGGCEARVLTEDGRLLAVSTASAGRLRTHRVFLTPAELRPGGAGPDR
jgi:tRNA pseudouridine55 synthase